MKHFHSELVFNWFCSNSKSKHGVVQQNCTSGSLELDERKLVSSLKKKNSLTFYYWLTTKVTSRHLTSRPGTQTIKLDIVLLRFKCMLLVWVRSFYQYQWKRRVIYELDNNLLRCKVGIKMKESVLVVGARWACAEFSMHRE